MITYTTTLTSAVQPTDGTVNVASATGITGPGPNKTTRTDIWIDRENLEVASGYVSGLAVNVVRGVNGTLAEYHALGQQVWIGAEKDFRSFTNEGLGLGLYSSLTRAFESTLPTTAIGTETLLESQLLGGEIVGTPTAAANYTLPTATALLAAIQAFSAAFIGITFYFNILNTAGGAFTITLVAGTGVTLTPASQTIAQNASARFKVVFTNILIPAYTVYPG